MHPIRYTHDTDYSIKSPTGQKSHPYTRLTQEEHEIRGAHVLALAAQLVCGEPYAHRACGPPVHASAPVLLIQGLCPCRPPPHRRSLPATVRAFTRPPAPCTARFTPAHVIPLPLPWEHAGSSLDPAQFPLLCPMLLYQSCIGGRIPGYTEKLGRF